MDHRGVFTESNCCLTKMYINNITLMQVPDLGVYSFQRHHCIGSGTETSPKSSTFQSLLAASLKFPPFLILWHF